MHMTATGPLGVLFALTNVDLAMHGVRARYVPSGKIVSGLSGYGETTRLVCTIDGKRASRSQAVDRLAQYIGEGERVELSGPIAVAWRVDLQPTSNVEARS